MLFYMIQLSKPNIFNNKFKIFFNQWLKGEPKYPCTLCDRKFVLNFMLQKHMNEFHGRIKITCKYCNMLLKRFAVINFED